MKRILRKADKFTFRLTREQKQQLEKLASQQNKRPSDFVRDLVLREMGRQAVAA